MRLKETNSGVLHEILLPAAAAAAVVSNGWKEDIHAKKLATTSCSICT
jgi:hypothetical protein